jgi:hypothetical protein
MYFSPTNGGFTTTFVVDDTVTAGTEIYINADIWYPNGYKWTFSHPNTGKEMEGVILKVTNKNFLNFSFFDILDYTT